MYSIGIHNTIANMLSVFYRVGLWHHGEATIIQTRIKLFYCLYYLLFPISLFAGASIADSDYEAIFLVEIGISTCVVSVKLWFLVWKKEAIVDLLNRIAVYEIQEEKDFRLVSRTMNIFSRIATGLVVSFCVMFTYFTMISPFIVSEKKLFFKVAFPYLKNDEISFWVADIFIITEIYISIVVFLFSTIIWYVLINCALRYKILGSDLRNIGVMRTVPEIEKKISNVEKQKMFVRNLTAAIDAHQHTRQLIQDMESLLSNLFFLQIVTSSLCICGSTYSLGFNRDDSLVERLFHVDSMLHHVSDIFMITNFGHEIMHYSDGLLYNLFESNWIDQPQSTKRLIISFAELIKQPHELVIGKLYPLTLETFTRIIKSAYSMFNILRNLK